MDTNASSSTLRKPRQFESESEIMEPGIDQNKPDVDQSLSFLHSQQKIDSSSFASVSQLSLFGKFSRFFLHMAFLWYYAFFIYLYDNPWVEKH